jgi:hypothetical protein
MIHPKKENSSWKTNEELDKMRNVDKSRVFINRVVDRRTQDGDNNPTYGKLKGFVQKMLWSLDVR